MLAFAHFTREAAVLSASLKAQELLLTSLHSSIDRSIHPTLQSKCRLLFHLHDKPMRQEQGPLSHRQGQESTEGHRMLRPH